MSIRTTLSTEYIVIFIEQKKSLMYFLGYGRKKV